MSERKLEWPRPPFEGGWPAVEAWASGMELSSARAEYCPGLRAQRAALDVCLDTTAKAFRQGPVRLDSRLNASQGHSRAAQAAKARAVKEMRQAFMLWAKALGPLPAKAVVLLVRCGPRRLDGDNLQAAWKAARDGLSLGWGVDDGDTSRVRWVYEQAKGEYSAGVYVFDAGVTP